MVRVTVEVALGTARYRVAVQAESVRRALEIVERLNPGGEATVVLPEDSGAFSAEDSVTAAGTVGRARLAA
jgi:hypothetical protein